MNFTGNARFFAVLVSLLTFSFCQQWLPCHCTLQNHDSSFILQVQNEVRSPIGEFPVSRNCQVNCYLGPGTLECCHTMPAIHPPFDRPRYHHFQLFCKGLHQLVNDSIMPLLVERPHVGLTTGHNVTYGLRLLPAHPAGRADTHTQYSVLIPVCKDFSILSHDHQSFRLCPESPIG